MTEMKYTEQIKSKIRVFIFKIKYFRTILKFRKADNFNKIPF